MHFIFCSALALLGMANVDLSAIAPSWVRFEQYVQDFGKIYKDNAEQKHRFRAFLQSEEEVDRLNALAGKNVYGLTKFSDLTKEEFKGQYLNFSPYENEKRRQVPVKKPINLTATSYDWRDHNAVTPVKDQGQCGSCWAFSATQTVESAHLVKYGGDANTFILSEQQLVSCDNGDGGCNGGDLPSAFSYVISAGGIASESSYPYTSGGGSSGSCKSFTVVPETKPTAYNYATAACYSDSCDSQDEGSLAANMETVGPIGICVNAESWQYYTGGVMSSSDCGGNGYYDLDHCVQAVGFEDIGSSGGYWIVKNSWASDWGEDGYLYLAYGSNTCGIADEAMFVTL